MIVDNVEVVLDREAIERLPLAPDVREMLLQEGERVARESAARAPKKTGAGAASIHPEFILDGDIAEVRVAWDREHFYMYFHQVGTRKLPAHPFMAGT